MPDTGKKVLIIEDDEFLSSLLRARLQKDGYDTKRVFDGQEALNLLKEFAPDIIILDIIMPRFSGWEFLSAMSVDVKLNKIPVIVLTQLGQEEDKQRAKSLGVKEYFIKARTSIDELARNVHKYVPTEGVAPSASSAPAPATPATPVVAPNQAPAELPEEVQKPAPTPTTSSTSTPPPIQKQ